MRILRLAAATVLGLGLAVLVACDASTLSPEPTQPATTPVPTPNTALAELRARVQATLTREGQIVSDLGTASAGAPGGLAAPAAALAALAAQEAGWADDNPPDACFADAHREYVNAMRTLAGAAEAFAELAGQPPSDDAGRAAAARLGDGTNLLSSSLRLADAARAECS